MDVKYASLVPFVLVLCHFAFDWLYQSHAEAIAKSKDRTVRFWHCCKYAVPFVPVLWALGMNSLRLNVSFAILFVTHYVIDSYVPVMLWAKHLRKAPQFDLVIRTPFHVHGWHDKEIEVTFKSDVDAFKAMAGTPLGLILIIVMDQFLHITCLLPIAFLAIK